MNSNFIIFYNINGDYVITVVLYINIDILYTLIHWDYPAQIQNELLCHLHITTMWTNTLRS